MTIGERIKEGRKSKGLTQQQLSYMSGVGRATIARCELGTTPPTFSTIEKIARALNVDTEALVSGEGWKVETPKTIGARVRAAREKKNLTREQLAHKIGASVSSVANLEKDLVNPKCKTILWVSKVLGVSAEYLFLGKEG